MKIFYSMDEAAYEVGISYERIRKVARRLHIKTRNGRYRFRAGDVQAIKDYIEKHLDTRGRIRYTFKKGW